MSGNWHIAWDIPYNGLMLWVDQLFGLYSGFPSYMIAAFLLPWIFGVWRFVIVHAIAGPILAYNLTTDLNEMPAIWCLFSSFLEELICSTNGRAHLSQNDLS